MNTRLGRVVLWVWAIIGVLVLAGAGAWGIAAFHVHRVESLKADYDKAVDAQVEAEEFIKSYEHLRDVGGTPTKNMANLYRAYTGKDRYLDTIKGNAQRAFEAWYKAKDQWW